MQTKQTRIALIHATRVAIDPIEVAAKDLWPEAELITILEEGLSIDRAANSVPMSQINTRIVDLARYAERLNPDGILYTCSAFGEGIEEAARTSRLPVLKPNEAMFDEALGYGNKISMIYTFPASVSGMEQEFIEAAERHRSKAKIQSIYAEGARQALDAGDVEAHDRIVADTAATINDASAVLLAHFSTATAATFTRAATGIPVLTSPESAIKRMKASVTESVGGRAG